MSDYAAMKRDVLGLLRDAAAFARGAGKSAVTDRLEGASGRLQTDELYVAVCGEFRRGKSSLINALLGAGQVCPVGVRPTTSLVTLIRHGEAEKFALLAGEPGRETSRVIRREDVARFVTEAGNSGNRENVRMLLAEIPSAKLKGGLVLADTPGAGSVHRGHTDVARALIPEADAVVFVADAEQPLSTKELEFAAWVYRQTQRMIFVVTKIDRLRDVSAVLSENRLKLASALGVEPQSLTVLGVSSRRKADAADSGDDRLLASSGFPEFEETLWGFLARSRGQAVLAGALNRLGQCLDELRAPASAELEVLSTTDLTLAESLESQWKEASNRLELLQREGAAWRTQLQDGLDELGAKLRFQFATGFRQIRRNVDVYLEDPALLDEPVLLQSRLDDDLRALVADLTGGLTAGAASIQQDLMERSGLGLNARAGGMAGPSPLDGVAKVAPKRSGWWEKTWNAAREGTFSIATGSFLGSVIGGAGAVLLVGATLASGAGIGMAVGGLLGKIYGMTRGLSRTKEADRAATRQRLVREVGHMLAQQETEISHSLGELMRKLQRELSGEFLRGVGEERSRCEEVLASIRSARNAAAEAGPRREAVGRFLALIEELDRRAAGLAARAIDQTAAPADETPALDGPASGEAPALAVAAAGADRGEWADG